MECNTLIILLFCTCFHYCVCCKIAYKVNYSGNSDDKILQPYKLFKLPLI